jgi:maleylpyruvate isomerase
MPTPHAEIAATALAHARLHATVSSLTDELAARPSRLPDWTIGHVITHLARNADSVVRRLSAAAKGELVTQYAGGWDARVRAIEAGATRPAAELLADLHAADDAVDALFAQLPAAVWDGPALVGSGDEVVASYLVFGRWREVETHHVDLGLGYEPADWPIELVERWLPSVLDGLAGRSEPRALLAWSLGRGPAPELAPWN